MTRAAHVFALALVLALVLSGSRTAAADGDGDGGSCEVAAAALRAQLTDESAWARRWNLGWGVGFAAVSAGQLGLAAGKWNPFGGFTHAYRDTLYVGAGKAAIGSLARLVTPLRIRVPAPQTDACADLAALRAVRAKTAKLERALFWTSQLGGLAVNLAGSIILGERDSWSLAALTFAYSYPIGLLSTYTMPRSSWHAWRIAPQPVPGGGVGLSVAGEF